jgi:hypothetical protein
MILALAGRRVDASDASETRFPLKNVERVTQALRDLFIRKNVSALVSSAACGADLIALSEAGKLGLRRRVVLPSGREKFRAESVVDRPGEWGGLFDAVVSDVEAKGDLVGLDDYGVADPFSATSRMILDEAVGLGRERHEAIAAAMVWDRVSRGPEDYTAEFGEEARKRGLKVIEVSTV